MVIECKRAGTQWRIRSQWITGGRWIDTAFEQHVRWENVRDAMEGCHGLLTVAVWRRELEDKEGEFDA